ncbi:MAG TPA: MFS transporter [Microvirga sp.]|jgi:MFS family permease|nr:MFS transporter [Microvirga sp.]
MRPSFLPAATSANARRLLAARGLRAVADGFISLILPAYLLALGYGPVETGIIATATLAGSAGLTLAVGLFAHRASGRALLMATSALMILTGFGFAGLQAFWPLLLVAFVGTLNPSAGDVSAFLPLEQAQLSQEAAGGERTRLFALYSFVGSSAGALGALGAGLPDLVGRAAGIAPVAALQGAFLLYAAVGALVLVLYAGLPRATAGAAEGPASALGPSRRIVLMLAALFSLDSFAGGFVVQSLLALWLYERFDLSLAAAGAVFFWTGLLSSLSYFAAVRIADRIGLVNTMVFTHLPANLCLLMVPFAPTLPVALGLLFVRSALSQMDVPTRTAYVMSVVTPAERAAAASVTAVPRSLAAAAGPTLAGLLLGATSFGWPLVIGGALKIVYDGLLLAMFRNVRPRDETDG